MHRLFAALALTVAIAGCGGDDDGAGEDGGLVVSGASSLQTAFTEYAKDFDGARLSFAGSDELAAQIEQGAKPDVFASANTSLPDELFDKGLVEQPVVFAGNRLVLAVPADGGKVEAFDDVTAPGVTLAIGSEGVPVGDYTRTVLDELPAAQRQAILDAVRSQEPDVKGIVGKLTQGAVDAGFVYITDVAATKGALRAIELPDGADPSVAYGVAVVKDAEHPEEAQRFVDGLLDGEGQRQLEAAGFEPPPTGS